MSHERKDSHSDTHDGTSDLALNAAALPADAPNAIAELTPVLSITPAMVNETLGTSFQIAVSINAAVSLYAFEFSISFNPAVIQVASVQEGPFLSDSGSTSFVPGTVNNVVGTVNLAADTLLGPEPGVNGSGTLLILNVTAVGLGSSALDLTGITLLNNVLQDITPNISDSTVNVVPCFARGTRITTPIGERYIEELRVGDTVVTREGLQLIRWIGHCRTAVSSGQIGDNVRPVRILAGAIAQNEPCRDLLLSPGHALHFFTQTGEVLIPAGDLVNGATIRPEFRRNVEYFHVELDRHEVVFANGARAESFRDTGNRACLEDGGMLGLNVALSGTGSTCTCVPLHREGPVWREVMNRLLARAEALGWTRVTDPDLHLMLDGTAVAAHRVTDARFRFEFAWPAHPIRLISRNLFTDRSGTEIADRRLLGVQLKALSLESADRCFSLDLGSASLSDGFYALENEGATQWRWTNGNARLPVSSGMVRRTAPCTLETTLGNSLVYWRAPVSQGGGCVVETMDPNASRQVAA